MLDIQQCATMACLLDVIVPKPGNVHRGADFEDATFLDFAASAVAIGPHIANASSQPIGKTVLEAIQATRQVVNTNTNLGIVLLLVPLAAVVRAEDRQQAMDEHLESLTTTDCENVFTAIRLANAGGLGKTTELDVNDTEFKNRLGDGPPSADLNLMKAMELSKDRDRIGAIYSNRFRSLLHDLPKALVRNCEQFGLLDGILQSYLENLHNFPDTLIARKCGSKTADEASARAGEVLQYLPTSGNWHKLLADLDFWLRSDGHKRNPGTTADVVTASVFVALNDGLSLGGLVGQ